MLGFVTPAKAARRRVQSPAKLHLELAKLEATKKAIALAIGLAEQAIEEMESTIHSLMAHA